MRYSDYSTLYTPCLSFFSGCYSDGVIVGAFYLRVTASATHSNIFLGCRLMFL